MSLSDTTTSNRWAPYWARLPGRPVLFEELSDLLPYGVNLDAFAAPAITRTDDHHPRSQPVDRFIARTRRWRAFVLQGGEWVETHSERAAGDVADCSRAELHAEVAEKAAELSGFDPEDLSLWWHIGPPARRASAVDLPAPAPPENSRPAGVEPSPAPNYGPSWAYQREKRIEMAGHQCELCGRSREDYYEVHGRDLDVHHRTPFREYGRENHREANRVENLQALCRTCHFTVEATG